MEKNITEKTRDTEKILFPINEKEKISYPGKNLKELFKTFNYCIHCDDKLKPNEECSKPECMKKNNQIEKEAK
jgi:hypothetical protein